MTIILTHGTRYNICSDTTSVKVLTKYSFGPQQNLMQIWFKNSNVRQPSFISLNHSAIYRSSMSCLPSQNSWNQQLFEHCFLACSPSSSQARNIATGNAIGIIGTGRASTWEQYHTMDILCFFESIVLEFGRWGARNHVLVTQGQPHGLLVDRM